MDSGLCSRKICLHLFLVLVLLLTNGVQSNASQAMVFNVRDFSAVGDGKTDDSKAFLKAWNQLCQYKGVGVQRRLLVPQGSYMVWPVVFEGPCTGPITFTVQGVVKAPIDESTFSLDHWIMFKHVRGLLINGGGTFDGQGQEAWPHNDCGKNPNCKSLPVSVRLEFVSKTSIRKISSVNSKGFHFVVSSSDDVDFRNVRISAPGDSPNTDGIHVGVSSHVTIADSSISTGDDCVSIGPGSNDVQVVRVHCGPGHGFSVGSLGKYSNEKDVSGLSVTNCTMSGTQNGVRIKSWATPLRSTAYNISFYNITMKDVQNPIIIDQDYCPVGGCSQKGGSKVQIKDVWFTKIQGTSASQVAVNLGCSPSVPCQNVILDNIDLTYTGGGGPLKSYCSHVNGESRGLQIPPSCIKPGQM